MKFRLSSILTLTLKNSYIRNDGAIYWQRNVPTDLRERYGSGYKLKQNLRTTDPAVAAVKIARLNKEHEALWKAMRADLALTPLTAREAALRLLKGHGIEDPRQANEGAAHLFFDTLESKRIAHAEQQGDPEEAYWFADDAEFLSKPEQEALRMLQGSTLFLFSDAIEVYLEEHQDARKPGAAKRENFTRACGKKFIDLLGDKELTAYTREDAKAFRDSLLAAGLKTASVKRNITPVRSVFHRGFAEKSLQGADIWAGLTIAGLGEDSATRPTIEHDDLGKLRTACSEADDDIRWLIAMQLDLGARIGEVTGLALSDIRIDGEQTPHVVFKHHPWRRLKNAQSCREVPLVGAALWGAKRVLAEAANEQKLAFPRYLADERSISADSASAAVNKWLRASGFAFTSHSFRHAMRDRLRNANAPKSIQDEVGGWGMRSDGDNYGRGTWLGMLQEFLQRSLDTAHGAPKAAT